MSRHLCVTIRGEFHGTLRYDRGARVVFFFLINNYTRFGPGLLARRLRSEREEGVTNTEVIR